MSFKKKAAATFAAIAMAGTVSILSAQPASALISSDHLVISGNSCGGSGGGIDWVVYAGGTSPAVVMATATSSSSTSTVSSHRGKGIHHFPSASSATTAPTTTGMDGSPAAGTSGSIRISAGSKLQSCRYECPFRKEGAFSCLRVGISGII